jgi:ABC transporter substrate binding protein
VLILLRQLISSRTAFFRYGASFTSHLFIWLGAVFLFSFSSATVRAQPLEVTVMLSSDGGPYREFSDALRRDISSDITLTVVNSSKSVAAGSGLLIAVGTKAAEMAAASSAPAILNVLIPKIGYEKLLRSLHAQRNPGSFSAIFLDQPAGRQTALIAAALPNMHQVGMLYSIPPTMELAQLRQKMAQQHLDLNEQVVDTEHPLPAALQELLKSSEILLALPDSNIYNSSTIRNILLTSYRENVPMIGFSPGYVRAGALCAVFSTPAQIATQTITLIREFHETHLLPVAQYPLDFEVAINEQVARSLDLQLKSPEELRKEIKASERNAQ